MEKIINNEKFKSTKLNDEVELACYHCSSKFFRKKYIINKDFKNGIKNVFCSPNCRNLSRKTKVQVNCENCGVSLEKFVSQANRSKNHFCGCSCSAIYRNSHKTHGTRRSKLEVYIENKLTILYPKLHIDFNKKDAINSELDVYIPSLRLAIELNGLFHYEPVFGEDKLNQIQNNDHRKFQACAENNISLCIIDVSSLKNFKEKKAVKFLEIVVDIINKNMSASLK